MADFHHKRYSRSPSPREARSRSLSRSPSPRKARSRSLSRSPSLQEAKSRSLSRSPSPREAKSRSPSPPRHRYRSRSSSRSAGRGREDISNPGNTLFVTGLSSRVTERDLKDHFNKEGKSKRKRPRTPTPGHYLGLGKPREPVHRGRPRGGYGRDEYDHRRSPRRSPYRGGQGYSPRRRSPYAERSRRYRSRSYSPYGSPDRGYGRRSGVYAR